LWLLFWHELRNSHLVDGLSAKSESGSYAPEEVVRLYGLRMWVELSYKQVKYALSLVRIPGQKRPRDAAGTPSWSAAPSPSAGIIKLTLLWQKRARLCESICQAIGRRHKRSRLMKGLGEKKELAKVAQPPITWPQALRAVRAWLSPWVLLRRDFQAWSRQPPPRPLRLLLEFLCQGLPLYLYATF